MAPRIVSIMARPDFPRSLSEFQSRVTSDDAGRRYLVACRGPKVSAALGAATVAAIAWPAAPCGVAAAAPARARPLRVRLASPTSRPGCSAPTTASARSTCPHYVDEFVFRFNRRRTPMAAFQSLLGLTTRHAPTTYQMLYAAEPTG